MRHYDREHLTGQPADQVPRPQVVLADLKEVILRTTGKEAPESAGVSLEYAAALCTQLIRQQNFDPESWRQVPMCNDVLRGKHVILSDDVGSNHLGGEISHSLALSIAQSDCFLCPG